MVSASENPFWGSLLLLEGVEEAVEAVGDCKIIFEFSQGLQRRSRAAHPTAAVLLTLQKAIVST